MMEAVLVLCFVWNISLSCSLSCISSLAPVWQAKAAITWSCHFFISHVRFLLPLQPFWSAERSVKLSVYKLSKLALSAAAASGYNGGPGSVGGSSYGVQPYDPSGHTQHAYPGATQLKAPSSPYGRQSAGGFAGAGFGSAAGVPANPYPASLAAAPSRTMVSHASSACMLQLCASACGPHAWCVQCAMYDGCAPSTSAVFTLQISYTFLAQVNEYVAVDGCF